MLKFKLWYALPWLLVCISLPAARAQNTSTAVDVKKIASAVDQHYNDLKSMETNFVETYRGAGLSRLESGTLWLKKPSKMRWEYRQPTEKLFVTDGKTAWLYVPGRHQATKAPLNKIDDLRSPLRFLLGQTKLNKEFHDLSLASNVKPAQPGNIVLKGVPKGMEDRISRIALEITPGSQIARIEIEEVDGATTQFQFENEKENGVMADDRFRFTPPAGTEVMEGADLGD